MTEDKFEQFIRNAAQDYNRPPEIAPREEMWARIQELQSASAPTPILRVERGGAAPQRFKHRTQWLGLAVAASILLVAGISIGRLTRRDTPVSSLPVQKVAVVPAPAVKEVQVSSDTTVPVQNTRAANKDASHEFEKEVRLASAASPKSAATPKPLRTQLDVESNRMNATYQLASLRHLAETEAMLTTFQSDSANRAMDPVVAKWSRDLLSNTRLLLDSPAARDPLRKHLLEDLELVLTQIVQLSNAPNTNERDMVESTIKEGHVMTRLRTAIPAGRPQGT